LPLIAQMALIGTEPSLGKHPHLSTRIFTR
jgi:hypothetical protein